MISQYEETLDDPLERSSFLALIKPVVDAAAPYVKCEKRNTGGQERVLLEFLRMLREWINAERWFCDGKAYSDVVDILRKSNKGNYQHVLEICRSHGNLHNTKEIVIRIIDSIAEAMKAESMEQKCTASIVAGAPSLRKVLPSLSEIGSMSSSNYTLLAVKARKLLFQESLPNLESRKLQINNTAQLLAASILNPDEETPNEVEKFIRDNIPLADLLYPLLRQSSSETQRLALVELYIRQMYKSQSITQFQHDIRNSCVKFKQNAKQQAQIFAKHTSVNSIGELKRRMSRHSLADMLETVNMSDNESDYGDEISLSSPTGTEACKLINNMKDIQNVESFENLLKSFPQYTKSCPKCSYGPKNKLFVIVLSEKLTQEQGALDNWAKHLEGVLAFFRDQLEEADIGLISFLFDNVAEDEEYTMPLIFSFHAQNGYMEDTLFRNIEPINARELHLNKLSKNFMVERLDSRHTSTINIHPYKATPRSLALDQDKKANQNPRIFVRALSYLLDFSSTIFEQMLVDSLNELDIVVHDHGLRKDNHLFMNLISDHEKIILDPVLVEQTVINVFKRYGGRISSLGLTEVETRLVCRIDPDSPPIAIRMMASNPTGYVQVMNTYIETEDGPSSQPIFRLVGDSKGNLACSGDSSWEGLKISAPYPLTRPFDAQRQAALRASDSLYCYDLPALFEEAVEQQWKYALENGEGVVHESSRPLMVTYTTELVVRKKNDLHSSWSMIDYLNGELELVQSQRRAGLNDVGMVAWLMTLKTFEYPQVRRSLVNALFLLI